MKVQCGILNFYIYVYDIYCIESDTAFLSKLNGLERVRASICLEKELLPDETPRIFGNAGELMTYIYRYYIYIYIFTYTYIVSYIYSIVSPPYH